MVSDKTLALWFCRKRIPTKMKSSETNKAFIRREKEYSMCGASELDKLISTNLSAGIKQCEGIRCNAYWKREAYLSISRRKRWLPKTGRPTVELGCCKEPAGYSKAPLLLADTVHVYFGVGWCLGATVSVHACMSVLLPVCVFSSTQDNRGG